MDTLHKLDAFMQHQGHALIGFNDAVEHQLWDKVDELKDPDNHPIKLTHSEYLELIDIVSNASRGDTLKAFNILYDSNINKLRVFEDGEWNELLIQKGLQLILKSIQENYLDKYECYLIKKVRDPTESLRVKQEHLELLDEYYKFLSCFNADPYVKSRPDSEILYDTDDDRFGKGKDEYTIEEEYMCRYAKIKYNLVITFNTRYVKWLLF